MKKLYHSPKENHTRLLSTLFVKVKQVLNRWYVFNAPPRQFVIIKTISGNLSGVINTSNV